MRKQIIFAASALALAGILSIVPSVSAQADEWRRDANGWWYEIDADDDDHDEDDDDYDDYAKSGWREIGGQKYYFDQYGYMKTGWVVLDDDDWYYLNPDGSLLKNARTPDGYWVDDDGEWDHKDSDKDGDGIYDDDDRDDDNDGIDDDHDDDRDDRDDDQDDNDNDDDNDDRNDD